MALQHRYGRPDAQGAHDQGHRVAGGDRLGKTIVFARNNDHAKFIEARFNLAYPEYAGHFARLITYQTGYGQSVLDDFSDADKQPHIAISIDMLDTGIDIPVIVNLVFFKLVRSTSKFWQMLGRGTRLRPDLYGPGQDKADFFIFDFCQNLEFFHTDPATVDGSLARSQGERLFEARVELVAALDKRGEGDGAPVGDGVDGTQSATALRAETAKHLNKIVRGMNLDNFVVRPARRWVESYTDEVAWAHLTPEKAADAVTHSAGPPSAERDDDEQAKRFDLLALRLQLSLLEPRPWCRAGAQEGPADRLGFARPERHPGHQGPSAPARRRRRRPVVGGRHLADARAHAPAAARTGQAARQDQAGHRLHRPPDEVGG